MSLLRKVNLLERVGESSAGDELPAYFVLRVGADDLVKEGQCLRCRL
jgi:hypothetical protein